MGADEEAGPEMETVAVARAYKAAAGVLGFTVFLLVIVTMGGTSWIVDGAERPYKCYGLFEVCEVKAQVDDAAIIEAEGPEVFECAGYEVVATWRSACQALMFISAVIIFISFIVLSVGICSAVEAKKFLLYKVAVAGYLLFVVLHLLVLIILPVKGISEELEDYSLGWAYILAWVNTVIVFISALFVIIDKGQELVEREKAVEEEEEEE